MEYSNRPPPDHINDPGTRFVIKDFIILVATAVVVALGVVIAAHNLGSLVGGLIPFSWEQKLGAQMFEAQSDIAPNGERRRALQALTDRLAAGMDLPSDMTVTVHLMDTDMVNAFATFGGNIVIMQGLVDVLESENGLAFVIAHEIAHVKRRHVMQRATAGLIVGLFHAVTIGTESDLGGLAGTITGLGALQFSRDNEREADVDAAAALAHVYGGVMGFDELFKHIKTEVDGRLPGEAYLSTHPVADDRISNLHALAEDNGWPVSGATKPIDLSRPGLN